MPQTSASQRSNMSADELRARAAEMRSEWAELSTSDRESDNFRSAKRQFLEEIDDIDTHLTLHGLAEQRASRPAPAGAVGMPDEAPQFHSAGDEVANNAEFRAWCEANAGGDHLRSNSPSVEVRTLVTTGSSAGALLPTGQPYLVTPDRRRLVVRDLLTVVQTGLGAIPYVREAAGAATATQATTVAEGGVKPEANITFVPDLAPITVIAVNIPITTQMLEDAPTIAGYINGRLTYMIKLTEEDQILNGNGTPPNLKGILEYDVQTQSAVTGETAITIGNAIAKVENANGFADGIVMNAADAWAMFMNRGETSGSFDAGSPFSSLPLTVWGMQTVRTNALPAGKALVGNFAMGATLFDRKAVNVRVYEQHANFPVLNQVLIQAEERVGLAVTRPDWFVDTTIA